MHPKTLVNLALLAVGLSVIDASSSFDRPSMLCDSHGYTTFKADNNPANPRTNNTKVCKPNHSHTGNRSLEAHDPSFHDKAEGILRLEQAFNAPFVTDVHQLPIRSDLVQKSWPGSYWATSRDGINYRWNGPNEPSASEKYAHAFGMDPLSLMERISDISGIKSAQENPACTIPDTTWENSNQGPQLQSTCAYGQVCGTRHGQIQGRCFALWEGICHAWAPASILEPEPKCPVTKNGVTFRVRDLKALITQVYFESNEKLIFVGARFDGDDNAPESLAKDKYGRYLDESRRDLGPGLFHLALTNVLGLLKKTVIVDKSSGSDVWNHAVHSYSISAPKYFENPSDFAREIYHENQYPFNPLARHLMQIHNVVKYVLESDADGSLTYPVINEQASTLTVAYDYVLELDEANRVIGGEWLGDSRDQHPDFMWAQLSSPSKEFVAPTSGLSYGLVRDLIDQSIATQC